MILMLKNTVEKAAALKKAGADCIFIPGALDEKTIIDLRENIELPINLFMHTAFHKIERLEEIGINRLSSGSAPVRTVFNKLIEVSADMKDGNCSPVLDHSFNYAAANSFFSS